MEHIGEIIKNKRTELKITQKKLSEDIGITQPFLAEIESGRKNPSIETLDKLCELLSLDIIINKKIDLSIEKSIPFVKLKKMLDDDKFNVQEVDKLLEYAKFLKSQRK